jgi:hypothetical protein
MLSDDEIVRRLREIRFSPSAHRNGRRAASINAAATVAGLSRMQVYRVIHGEPLGARARAGLSEFLTCHVITGQRSGGPLR